MRASTAIACALVVAITGCRKQDPLFCANHEDPRCGNIDGGVDAAPDAPPGYITIGGNVDGLGGDGLVIQNNLGDDLAITVKGNNIPFQFVTPIEIGMPYSVTVSGQPTAVTQSCIVDPNGASGTAMANVSDVHITCSTVAFPVSGAVVGLGAGDMITLTLNGVDPQPMTADGAFAFDTAIDSGAGYDVEAKVNMGSKMCRLGANNGAIGNAAVTDVQVNCDPSLFTLSGTISGLNGTVTLIDGHGTDSINVAANGGFAFTPVPNGTYAINVSVQPMWSPTTPAQQTCMVTANATPTINNADFSGITVVCTTNVYPVGGNVYDLIGSVTLANGGDNDMVNATGPFTFGTQVASGATYLATVKTQPANQTCIVSNPNGTIQASPITNISVACDSGIKCGGAFCTPGTQQCCDPEGGASCQTTGSACGHLVLPCADATDCAVAGKPTNVCCAAVSGGHVNSAACSATCTGGGNVTLCDPNIPGVCSGGTTCKQYNAVLNGYYACQ